MRRPYQTVRGAPPELKFQLPGSIFIDNNQVGVPGGRGAERLIAQPQAVGPKMKGPVLLLSGVTSGQRCTPAAAKIDDVKSQEHVAGMHRRRQASGYDESAAPGRLNEPGGATGLAGVLGSCPKDDRPLGSTAFTRCEIASRRYFELVTCGEHG